MGCGAIQVQVSPISPTLSLQQKIKYNLKNYQFNHLLTQQECKTILDYIQQQNLPNYNQIQQTQNQNELVSKFQRTIWKIILFGKDKNIFKQYLFTQNPVASNQKLIKQFDQISRDVHRTYPELLKDNNRKQLKIILENVNIFYPNVGYTQGMNYYIGFLLLCGFSAQQSFWLFITLSSNKQYLMIMNFAQGFPMTMHTINVFQQKLLKYFPHIHLKLQKYGINPHLYAFSWFLCYFLYSHHPLSCTKIWSYFIRNQGIISILSISLAFITKYEAQIIEANNPEEIIKILQMRKQSEPLSEQFIDQLIEISKAFQISHQDFQEEETLIGKIKKNQQEFKLIMQHYKENKQNQ